MDWNVRPLQNAVAKNPQSQDGCYSHLLSNAHTFPERNSYSSANACTYPGNNQTMYVPTSNTAFSLVNVGGFKTSDQALPGTSVSGNDYDVFISKHSADRPRQSYVPIAPKPPKWTSHLQAEITQTSWPASNAYMYSHRNLPPLSSQSSTGSNVRSVHQDPQYATTNGYAGWPQIPQPNSMRTTSLYQSTIHSQSTSASLGMSGQLVQNQTYHPNAQFQVLHSLNQNTEANVQRAQYQPSPVGSEAPSGCSAPSLLPANCDSRAAAQSSIEVSHAVQSVPSRYTFSQQRYSSDQKNVSGFNSVQQQFQKQLSGGVGQSVGTVCKSSGSVTASHPLSEMSVPSPDIYKELYSILNKMETLSSVAASKQLSDPASGQESLKTESVNSQISSAGVEGRTNAGDRLAWESQKLLAMKKRSFLLEKMDHFRRRLLAASEYDEGTLPAPPSYQDTVSHHLCAPNQNVLASSETVRIGSPKSNSLSEERRDKNVVTVDNRRLEVTQSNHWGEQGSLSSTAAPVPSQSKRPAPLKNPESTPVSAQRGADAVASSETVTSLNNASSFSQVSSSIKTASKNVPSYPENSSFLQFVLSSTNILKEKTAGATADKILTNLLCNEKTLVDTSASDGNLLKDTNKKNTGSLKGEQAFVVHTNGPVSETTGSGEAEFQSNVAQKKKTLTENTSFKQNSHSVEEVTVCLGLWKKGPSEAAKVQKSQSNESPAANRVSLYNQNTKNREQNVGLVNRNTDEAVLPVAAASAGQKLDTLGCNLIKSIELQVAVVSPLVLAKKRTWSEQADKCPTSAAKTYPVIDLESTCSLQEEGENDVSVVNADKETVEIVDLSPSDCVLVEKEDSDLQQTKLADGNTLQKNSVSANDSRDENRKKRSQPAQDTSENLQQGLQNKPSLPEFGPNFSSQIFQEGVRGNKDKQALLETEDTSTVVNAEQMLCISSVCSLVEGDRFYNPQIASIFRSDSETQALNGSSSEENASEPRQKKQRLDLYKNKLSNNTPQRETLLQKMLGESSSCTSKARTNWNGTTISHLEKENSGSLTEKVSATEEKILPNLSIKHPENDLEIPASVNQQSAQNSPDSSISVTAETDLSTVPRDISKQNDVLSKQSDMPSKNSTEKEVIFCDAEPLKCLNNQLSELMHWFPYGIESANLRPKEPVRNNSVTGWVETQPQKETQTCDKNTPLKDPVDEIKIKVLSSDQIQELFPEHNRCSSDDSRRTASQQSEKVSAEEENAEGSVHPGQSLCESEKKTPKTPNPIKEEKDHSSVSLSVPCKIPQDPCKLGISDSEKNDDQLSKAEHTSCTESQLNDSKSDDLVKNECAVEKLHVSERVPNSISTNEEDISKCTSVMCENAELKASNECKEHVTQQERIGPPNSSENQDADESKSSNLKEELQISGGNPLLDKELCSDKKEEEVFKPELFAKDETKPDLAMKSEPDIHECTKSETVEIKHAEVDQGQKINTCEKYSGEGQDCRKQKEILDQDVEINIRSNANLTEVNHKNSNSYGTDAINFPNCSTVDFKSRNPKYLHHKSVKVHPSQEQSYKRKRNGNVIGKRDPKKIKVEEARLKHLEAKNSKHFSHPCMINTDKAKKLNREKGCKRKSSLADRSLLKLHKKGPQSSTVSKSYFSSKDKCLDIQNQDNCSEKMFPDKNLLYLNRRNNRLKLHVQKEPKIQYLNRVAFKRTSQERIYLTKLETSPVRHVRHAKPRASKNNTEAKRDTSVSEVKAHRLDVLEFKLCPEILFRNPAADEEISAANNSVEREKTVVAGVKSKKEDWLKCDAVKQKKLEGIFTDEDCIPLDTAIKLLDGDGEALHIPVKDSKEVFQTYRKMYLEKKTQKP
ncbi:retroelement silencing factor 1 [Pogoniulus pusillus]|uniref:retroelement silencing factor 1 n=1 Tax=Pogoniulus pusillus TaxID=488313 RepID=UPI0030B98398